MLLPLLLLLRPAPPLVLHRAEVSFFDVEATTGGLLQGLNEDALAVQAAISDKVRLKSPSTPPHLHTHKHTHVSQSGQSLHLSSIAASSALWPAYLFSCQDHMPTCLGTIMILDCTIAANNTCR